MDLLHTIVCISLVSLLLHLLNTRVLMPVVAIANRWIRWGLFSLGTAYMLQKAELTDRPIWSVAVVAFLGWFLLESVYHWLAIRALSVSPLPLFPRYVVNSSGEEWPTHRRLIAVRDWMRRERFHLVQSLKAEIAPGLFVRLSVHQDFSNTIRLQIAFIPQANGSLALCYTLSSCTEDERRFVTDNLSLPYGGFYPDNWVLERRPWTRSLPRLLARHRRRLDTCKAAVVAWSNEPLEDLNRQQHQIERVNTELGFLHSQTDREEYGKLSKEGRYRVWKEIWLLNYLGRTVGY